MDKSIEQGFTIDISKGLIKEVSFARVGTDTAWGIEPGTKHVTWTYGKWTIGKDLFLEVEQARVAGEVKRAKKLASLKKQIGKLEKMVFRQA